MQFSCITWLKYKKHNTTTEINFNYGKNNKSNGTIRNCVQALTNLLKNEVKKLVAVCGINILNITA